MAELISETFSRQIIMAKRNPLAIDASMKPFNSSLKKFRPPLKRVKMKIIPRKQKLAKKEKNDSNEVTDLSAYK
jgi:hypothetical protein